MMLLHLRPGHGEEQENTVFWAFSKPDGHVSAHGGDICASHQNVVAHFQRGQHDWSNKAYKTMMGGPKLNRMRYGAP